MQEVSTSNGGIGVLFPLGILFVVLKLMGIIDWSWWLVTLPFWAGLAIVFIILATTLTILAIVALGIVIMELSKK